MTTIQRNHKREKHLTALFEQAKVNAEKAIKLYEKMTGQTLQPEQWGKLLSNPSELVKTVFLAGVKVPPGMQPEKYKDMIELPDTSELKSLLMAVDPEDHRYHTNYCSPAFLSYNGREVVFTENVNKVIVAENITLSENVHEIYQLTTQLVELQNLLLSKSDQLDLIKPNPFVVKEHGSGYKVKADTFTSLK